MANTLKPFKYIVQMIALEMDGDGNPVGERILEPVPCYGKDALLRRVDEYEQALASVEHPAADDEHQND